jgi:hypothetical protein
MEEIHDLKELLSTMTIVAKNRSQQSYPHHIDSQRKVFGKQRYAKQQSHRSAPKWYLFIQSVQEII